jgi:hypothetical protein
MLCAIPVAAHAAGAIAVDDEEGDQEAGYGISTGADSRDEAGAEALKQCKSAGNQNCKVVARFDSCGAYAASKQYYGVGWGSSEQKAIDMALGKCGDGCHVVVSECE